MIIITLFYILQKIRTWGWERSTGDIVHDFKSLGLRLEQSLLIKPKALNDAQNVNVKKVASVVILTVMLDFTRNVNVIKFETKFVLTYQSNIFNIIPLRYVIHI